MSRAADPSFERRAMEVFLDACDLDEAERPAFVDRACAGDELLAARVGELLASDASEADPGEPVRRLAEELVTGQAAVTTDDAELRVPGHHILERLGAGGAGVVHRARHERLGRDVALKMLLPDRLGDPSLAARFRAESEAVARLQHPNIVQVFEVGECDGRPYIAFEYVPGGTLAQAIAGARQPARWSAEIVEALARAIHLAHVNGIVHRDLKPSNVLLADDGTPKIADFGLAKRVDRDVDRTRTGVILGTPGYMAPEQVTSPSVEVGPAADVHALGVILYEMLAGFSPYRADTTLETLRRITSEDPPPLRPRAPDVSRDLETICLKALAKEPTRRYGTAAALADDLRRFLDHRTISARRLGPLDRLRLWCRRRPAVAATIATASVIVLGVTAISVRRIAEERDAARAALYGALVSDARARIQARGVDWHSEALDRITEAAASPSTARDPNELRRLVSDLLGAESAHFGRRGSWHVGRALALDGSAGRTVVLTEDDVIHVFDVTAEGLEEVGSMPAVGATTIAVDSTGDWLATGSTDGTLRLFRTSKPGPPFATLAIGSAPISAVACAAGADLVIVGDVTGRTWSVRREGRVLRPRVVDHREAAVAVVAVSPSGSRIAIGSHEPSLRVRDLERETLVAHVHMEEPLGVLEFDGDEEHVLLAHPAHHGLGRMVLAEGHHTTHHRHAHAGSVTHLSRERGGRLVSTARDGTVVLWDERGVRRRASVSPPGGAIRSATLVGDVLITAHDDGALRAWTIVEPAHHAAHDPSHGIAFTDDGAQLVLSSGSVVRLRPGTQQVPGRQYEPAAVRALAVNGDGRGLALGREDATLEIWTSDGSLVQRRPTPHGVLSSLARSPGDALLAAAGSDGTVTFWDWRGDPGNPSLEPGVGPIRKLAWPTPDRLIAVGATGVALFRRSERRWETLARHDAWPTGATESGDTLYLGAADGNVTALSMASGEVLDVLPAAESAIASVAVHDAPPRLAVLDELGRVTVMPLDGEGERATWTLERPARWIEFTPGGNFVLIGDGRGLTAWAADRSAPSSFVTLAGSGALCTSLSPDGRELYLGTIAGTVRRVAVALLDERVDEGADGLATTRGGTRIEDFEVVVPGGHLSMAWGLAASADGRWLATASHDATVKLWRAPHVELARTLSGHRAVAWCVAFSPDSRRVVSGSISGDGDDAVGELRAWDVESGALLATATGHDRLVTGLAFAPSGDVLYSAGLDGQVLAWDATTLAPRGLVHAFDGASLAGLAVSPDGRSLVAVGDGHRAWLWWTHRIRGPSAPDHVVTVGDHRLWAAAFSPSGRYLAVGSAHGDVTLLDGHHFQELFTLPRSGSAIRSLAFDPTESRLAAGAYVSPSVVWDLDRVRATLANLGLEAP